MSIASRLKADRGKKDAKGFDGYKRVNGRKRHIIVDTLGLILSTVVTAANVQDRDALKLLCNKMKGLYPRMSRIFADFGYEGRQNSTLLSFGWLLSITKRPRKQEPATFQVIHKRWIVERTFAWLGCFRRLSIDYETSPSSAEAFIMLANIHICLKRIS